MRETQKKKIWWDEIITCMYATASIKSIWMWGRVLGQSLIYEQMCFMSVPQEGKSSEWGILDMHWETNAWSHSLACSVEKDECIPRGVTRAEAGMTMDQPCLPSQGGELYPLGCQEPLYHIYLRISMDGKDQTCILERSLWAWYWGGFANGDPPVRKSFRKPRGPTVVGFS